MQKERKKTTQQETLHCHSKLHLIRLSTHLLLIASFPFVLLLAARVYTGVVSTPVVQAACGKWRAGNNCRNQPTDVTVRTGQPPTSVYMYKCTLSSMQARGTNEPSTRAFRARAINIEFLRVRVRLYTCIITTCVCIYSINWASLKECWTIIS